MLRRLGTHFRNQWTGTLALFLVLTGGTALAVDGSLPGQNTVGSADIINGEVAGDDLGPSAVGSAKIADGAVKNADLAPGASASNTIKDGSVEGVDVKDNSLRGADIDESSLAGVSADALDGRDSSEFAPAGAEAWHEIGAAGEPGFGDLGFGCVWSNYGGGFNTAAFYKDPWGVVHLKGLVKATDAAGGDGACESHSGTAGPYDTVIFRLPGGYRPAALEVFPVISSNQLSRLDIQAPEGFFFFDGEVYIDQGIDPELTNAEGYVSLDGITFRAAD